MKVFASNKGAVSVFLVMILVPTLIVTSIFVDVSRMFLGKSVTESAGDLALNSQLSQFDKELNDLYGLFATAKDANDVSDNLNKYFESCLVSAGVETTDASHYGAILTDLVDEEMGDEYSDLLKISVSEDASITAVDNGNLGNPEVLKNQIVNFMKYRGPVDIAQNFMSRMTSVKDKVDIVDDEAEVTDTMNSYYESENKVLENLYEAYQKMKNYQQNSGMNETFVNNLKTELSNLEENYKTQHIKMFKDLYNTQGIGYILSTPTTISKFQTKLNSVSQIKNMDEDEAERNFDKYVRDAQSYIDKFELSYNKVLGLYNTYIGQYAKRSPTSETGVNSYTLKTDVYPIQWYVALSKESNKSELNDFGQKANNMNYYVARAYKAQQLSGKTSDAYDAMISEYKKYAENPNRSDSNNNYDKRSGLYVVDAYIEPFRNLINRVYNNDFKNNISTDSVNQFLKDTSQNLKDNYQKIKDAKKLVTDANTYLEDAKKELTNNTNSCYSNWESALGNSVFDTTESDVANSSKEAKESAETQEFREKVTEESINAMISRLNNIETLLQNMLDLIDSYKYNGKKVKDINSYNTFKNNSGINSNDIVINKNTLETNANNSFKFSSNSLNSIKVDNNNNPDLEHNPKPALYDYLKIKFVNEQSSSTEKDLYEDVKDLNDDDDDTPSSDDDELSDNEIGSDSDEKESISKKISKISENITGLFNGIGDVISNPTKARDDLYVLDYAMNMFSYHTYNKEGIYNLALKDEVSGLDNINTVKNLGSKTSSSLGCTYAEAWKNEDTTFTDNKTLTNNMINLENNYSFGNEIEYILNGKNNEANKSAIFAKIFMIRYAFDLGPQFSYHWDFNTGRDLNQFAITVNTACPFIPAVLVKTVAVLALTAAEAASDLNELKAGMKVKLVKGKDDLKFTFSVDCLTNLVNNTATAESGTGTPASELNSLSYFQYSDYLSIFLFIDLINTNKENEIMTRIGDVIGRNVGVAKGYSNSGDEIFKMSEANTYYCLKTKVQVQPLLLSLPLLQDDKFNKSSSVSWWTWEYSIVRGYN